MYMSSQDFRLYYRINLPPPHPRGVEHLGEDTLRVRSPITVNLSSDKSLGGHWEIPLYTYIVEVVNEGPGLTRTIREDRCHAGLV